MWSSSQGCHLTSWYWPHELICIWKSAWKQTHSPNTWFQIALWWESGWRVHKRGLFWKLRCIAAIRFQYRKFNHSRHQTHPNWLCNSYWLSISRNQFQAVSTAFWQAMTYHWSHQYQCVQIEYPSSLNNVQCFKCLPSEMRSCRLLPWVSATITIACYDSQELRI